MIKKLILLYEVFIFSILPLKVVKAEISADFHGGAVRVGAATDVCNSAIKGSIRWNDTDKTLEFCNSTSWTTLIPTCNALPDDFNFSNVTGASASATQTSAIKHITGISCADADVSITGGGSPEFRTCSDAACATVVQDWTTTTSPISNNQYLQLRLTTSGTSLGLLTATVTVGGQTRNWSVTTQDLGTFKYVFVTSSTTAGNFGGVAAADTICSSLAGGAGLGGTWKAWVSTDSSNDPESRFTHSTIPYRLVNGTIIANDWNDLTDGNLTNGIILDEAGVDHNGDGHPWTNVEEDGTSTGTTNNCNNWTVDGNGTNGINGWYVGADNEWSHTTYYNTGLACDSYWFRLYCFQQ